MQTKTWNKKRFHFLFVAIVILALIVALVFAAGSAGSNDNNEIGNTENNSNTESHSDIKNLVIPISEISETVTFYPITIDGIRMEVLVVKAPDGTIRTAFNTCHVCNDSPYAYFEQEGSALVCQNCGNRIPIELVGIEAGGCGPIPIIDTEKTATDEFITISLDTLQANTHWFPPNWKPE